MNFSMIKSHRNEATHKLEIMQVIWIHIRGWIDLQRVVVLVGVLEKAVHWVEYLVGKQKEPFPEK